MKREQFIISCNGEQVAIKSKWNSACRHIEKLVKEAAQYKTTVYDLVDSGQTKIGFGFSEGFRTWQSKLGDSLKFTITKVN